MANFTLALTLPFPFPAHSPHPVTLLSSKISQSGIIVPLCFLIVDQTLIVEALVARVPELSPQGPPLLCTETFACAVVITFEGYSFAVV